MAFVDGNVLQQMAHESKRLGYVPGESAAQFRERDPEAAAKLARWLRINVAAVSKALSSVVRAA